MNDKERTKRFNRERQKQLKKRTRLFNDTRKELLRLLTQAEKNILATLASAPTDWETFYLPQLQRSIQQAMKEFEQSFSTTINTKSEELKTAGVALVDEPLNAGGLRVAGILPEINIKQLTAMRSFMTNRITDISLSAANAINSELGLVAIGAQPQSTAVANIKKLLKTKSRQRAITIIRTELGRVYSIASDERMKQASELLPGLKKRWLKSNKRHSRTIHDLIHNQVQDVKDKFQLPNGVQLEFPRDPAAPAAETINCGCVSVPHVEEWKTATVPLAA